MLEGRSLGLPNLTPFFGKARSTITEHINKLDDLTTEESSVVQIEGNIKKKN